MAKQPTPKVVTKKHLARLERERLQQRYLLIGLGVVIVLVLAILLYGYLDQAFFKQNRPVARVGTESITVAEFQKEVRFARFRQIEQLRSLVSDPFMAQFLGSYIQQLQQQLSSPTTIGQDVLDQMVEDILVQREAERRGITIDEAALDQLVEEAFGFYANGTPTPSVTPTEIVFSTATLNATQLALAPPTATAEATAEANGEVTGTPQAGEGTPVAETPAEGTPAAEAVTGTPDAAASEATAAPTVEVTPTITLTPTITPTPTQYTRDLYEENFNTYSENIRSIRITKADLRDFIRRQQLRQKVYEAITADVATVGEQIWARHILVATEAEARAAIDRLNNGEDFAKLAAELSTDTSNKDQGGDLNWFGRGRMVEEFDNAAFALTEIGQISEPVQTQFGFHVIQLLGREQRPQDASQLQASKDKAFQDWVEAAKAEANVETFDNWVDVVPTEPEVPPELLINTPQ